MRKCELTLGGSLRMESIERVVSESAELLTACKANDHFDLELSLERVSWVEPAALAVLGALAKLVRTCSGFSGGRAVPPTNEKVHTYLNRMGFYDFLGLKVDYPFTKHDSTGRFCELVQISDEGHASSVVNDIGNIIRSSFPLLTKDETNTINIAIGELTDNVFNHAHSPISAIVCAQSYQNASALQIGIVDCGIGIRESLEKSDQHFAQLHDDYSAIQLAIQPKVTGRANYNMGYGLYVVDQIVRQNRGDLLIYSGNAYHQLS